MINRERLLERFLKYVRVDTTAREASDRGYASILHLQIGAIRKQHGRNLKAIKNCGEM